MLQKTISLLAVFSSFSLFAQQVDQTTIINFETSSSLIDSDGSAILSRLCDTIDAASVRSISILGYADSRGDKELNVALGLRRASSVRDVLLENCFPLVEIYVGTKGESESITRQPGAAQLALDRKVVITVSFDALFEANIPPNMMDEIIRLYPDITALIPAVDKVAEVHTVDPSNDIIFQAKDSVVVRIPANSIVRADGTPVREAVEISYRSFSEPYEIIASGIPMHIDIDEGQGLGHFETAGMYDLSASLNGEELQLAPGQQIELRRPANKPIPDGFNTYVIDPSSGSWQSGGSTSSEQAAVLPASNNRFPVATKSVRHYMKRMSRLSAGAQPDSNTFEYRYADVHYAGTSYADTNNILKPSWTGTRNRYKKTHAVAAIRVRPSTYSQYKKSSDTGFTLDFGAGKKYFPEWRYLPANIMLVYDGLDSRKSFKRSFARRHWYQDVHLVLNDDATSGILRLKETGEWRECPVSISEKSNSNILNNWPSRYSRYLKKRARRSERFNGKTEYEHANWTRKVKERMPRSWNSSKSKMNYTEDTLSMLEFDSYASSFLYNRFTGNEYLSKVQTIFNLQGFGIYNIDRIMKMKEEQDVNVLAVLENGEEFRWQRGYGVLADENSVITYWGSPDSTNPMKVAQGKMRSLFLVNSEGQIAIADVAPLNQKCKKATIKCQLLVEPKSIEDLQVAAAR